MAHCFLYAIWKNSITPIRQILCITEIATALWVWGSSLGNTEQSMWNRGADRRISDSEFLCILKSSPCPWGNACRPATKSPGIKTCSNGEIHSYSAGRQIQRQIPVPVTSTTSSDILCQAHPGWKTPAEPRWLHKIHEASFTTARTACLKPLVVYVPHMFNDSPSRSLAPPAQWPHNIRDFRLLYAAAEPPGCRASPSSTGPTHGSIACPAVCLASSINPAGPACAVPAPPHRSATPPLVLSGCGTSGCRSCCSSAEVVRACGASGVLRKSPRPPDAGHCGRRDPQRQQLQPLLELLLPLPLFRLLPLFHLRLCPGGLLHHRFLRWLELLLHLRVHWRLLQLHRQMHPQALLQLIAAPAAAAAPLLLVLGPGRASGLCPRPAPQARMCTAAAAPAGSSGCLPADRRSRRISALRSVSRKSSAHCTRDTIATERRLDGRLDRLPAAACPRSLSQRTAETHERTHTVRSAAEHALWIPFVPSIS